MPQFTVNAGRFDPYKNFKFRVIWDGRAVAGVSRVGGLSRVTEVITHREGGDPSTSRKSPGLTQYEPLVIERGVSHDAAFEQWANKVHNIGGASGEHMSLADFRKDVRLELFNEAGQLALAYTIYRCWPSEYHALPELDANFDTVAIQRLVLENEGWARDVDVSEPAEPSLGSA
jgi:phage tail-like protein